MVRFTWVADFYIATSHRANGLGKALLSVLQSRPSFTVPHVMQDCNNTDLVPFFARYGKFVPVTREDQLDPSTMYKWIPPEHYEAKSKDQLNIRSTEEMRWLPHPNLPGYYASTDISLLDMVVAHEFLTNSYWAAGISLEKVQLAMKNSDCIGIYHLEDSQGGTYINKPLPLIARLRSCFTFYVYR
jgi:hypothetical protein